MKKLILEYTEGFINKMVKVFQSQDPNLSDVDIKPIIMRFDQIKGNIKSKLDTGQMTLPKKFTEPNPKTGKLLDYTNLENYTWKDLESVIDAYGIKASKTNKDFYSTQEAKLVNISGVDIKYESPDGLIIYDGSNYESCIKLNYAFKYKGKDNKIYTYNFCIGRKEAGSNQYFSYRFGRGGAFRTFYFVVDSSQSTEIKGNANDRENFKNWYHFFVIHSFQDGKYGVTDAVNQYGSNHETTNVPWEGIGQFMIKNGKESGRLAWEKIKNLKDKFPYINPPDKEVEQSLIQGRTLDDESFKNLTREQKRIYISGKASESSFTSGMFAMLDPELKNAAIQNGYTPSFDEVKEQPKIANIYAKFRYKRIMDELSNGGAMKDIKILPLPYIQYLEEDKKEKLLDLMISQSEKEESDYITFQYVLRFWGEKLARDYANKEAKTLNYLPKEAVNYIDDPNLKKYYLLYGKLTTNWADSSNTNVSDKALSKMKNMIEQVINPSLIDLDSWLKMPKEERELANSLSEKYDKNPKFAAYIYAAPILLIDKKTNKKYNIVNAKKSNEVEEVALVDEDGKVIKNNININKDILLDNSYINKLGFLGSNRLKKVCDFSELKLK